MAKNHNLGPGAYPRLEVIDSCASQGHQISSGGPMTFARRNRTRSFLSAMRWPEKHKNPPDPVRVGSLDPPPELTVAGVKIGRAHV